MAKLPTSLRVLKQDLKDSPNWASRLIDIYNSFNEALYEAMNGHVTFKENIQCQIKELSFTTNSDYSSGNWTNLTFLCPLKTNPFWVELTQIYMPENQSVAITEPISIDWIFSNGTVVIRHITGLENSTKYFTRFMVT